MNAQQWIERFAAELGVAPPTAEEFDALLGLAANAAHGSERTAAPVACWLAAKAGVAPDDARNRSARISPSP
ncbi:MAG: hypothetical protein H0W70_04445 [Actinobacteria bacterium]|nr:hypothetical protein [Actinomycetota bacterium]